MTCQPTDKPFINANKSLPFFRVINISVGGHLIGGLEPFSLLLRNGNDSQGKGIASGFDKLNHLFMRRAFYIHSVSKNTENQ